MISQLPPPPTRDDPSTFAEKGDALLAALPRFVDEANQLEQSLQRTSTIGTSETALAIGAGVKDLVTEAGKAWSAGAWLYIVAAGSIENAMVCKVVTYDPDTGDLSVSVGNFSGAGTFDAWLIGLALAQVPMATSMYADESVTKEKIARGVRYTPGEWVFSISTTAPRWTLVPNGQTIGSATSGATSRANADTFDLFEVLWNSTSNADLPIKDSNGVNTVRGGTAALDFAANKRMPLPNLQDGDSLVAAVASAVAKRTVGQVLSHTHEATSGGAGGHNHEVARGPSEGDDLATTTNGTGSQNPGVPTSHVADHTHVIAVSETGGANNLAAGLYTRVYIAM